MTTYSVSDVTVPGGQLRVGCWDSADVAAGAPVRHGVLAFHGITASHLAWTPVARALTVRDGVRVIAPDLRGRGRSNGLPGPAGMPRHADDAALALDGWGLDRVCVLGHSMGGFASVVFARRHAERASGIVLVDGGVPIPLPAGMSAEQALRATLGPAAERLRMTFESRAAYQDFWRVHPALGPSWNADIAAYVDYDLEGEPPELHSSCRYELIEQDSTQLGEDGSLLDAWDNLAEHLADHVCFLRAPRGLLGDLPGLYPPDALAAWRRRVPGLRCVDVPGTNHYTITFAEPGVSAVAEQVFAQLSRTPRRAAVRSAPSSAPRSRPDEPTTT